MLLGYFLYMCVACDFFFFKQKTAYEMRISDWSSDVCSSDLSLTDDDWLWGGDLATIDYTITHGIRNPDHKATRTSLMPAFGRDGILDAGQIADVVSHVRVISRQEKPSASSARGATLFEANCAVCHGPAGEGGREVGAPKLTDSIWLYGGDRASITATVTEPRNGVMPRWNSRLDPVTIKMLAAYVSSLGGGEKAPRSEEHTSELQSLMRIPYAVFCLQK